MNPLAKLIWASIDKGAQLVLSTHSLELIDTLLRTKEASLYGEQVAVYRTGLKNGNFEAIKIPGDEAFARLDQVGEDLRR